MIPDETTIRVDSRPHPGMGEEPVRSALQACVDRVAERFPDTRYEMILADRKDSYLIDRDHFQQLRERLEPEKEETLKRIRKSAGEAFNPASATAIRRLRGQCSDELEVHHLGARLTRPCESIAELLGGHAEPTFDGAIGQTFALNPGSFAWA